MTFPSRIGERELTRLWRSPRSTRVVVLGTILLKCFLIVVPTGLMTPGGDKGDFLSIFLIVQLSLLWVMQLFWWIGLCKMTFDQTIKGTFNDFFHDTVSSLLAGQV